MAKWPYNTTTWARLRTDHLAREPLCVQCKAEGRFTPANTVDHLIPIRQGGAPFPGHSGLVSYCAPCHSAKTARGPEAGAIRTSKPRKGCNTDGTPLDPAHPWNGGNGRLSKEAIERRMPKDLRHSAIPLTIVAGPPGSGKSTYVRQHMAEGDLVICLDTIVSELTGLPEHHPAPWIIGRALDKRNAMLRSLATEAKHNAAWFIVGAPTQGERNEWISRLGGSLVVINTPLSECVRRIKDDPSRSLKADRMIDAATQWWKSNPHIRQSLRADNTGPTAPIKPQLVDDWSL